VGGGTGQQHRQRHLDVKHLSCAGLFSKELGRGRGSAEATGQECTAAAKAAKKHLECSYGYKSAVVAKYRPKRRQRLYVPRASRAVARPEKESFLDQSGA